MSAITVITTVHAPTVGVQAIGRESRSRGHGFIVIGDVKSPEVWQCEGADYYSFSRQMTLSFSSAKTIPPHSYSRKMLGYLLAGRAGCSHVRETDDDNIPLADFYVDPPSSIQARVAEPVHGWVNVYSYFSKRFIWPRGFPLERLHDVGRYACPLFGEREVSGPLVFQALANGDPDVDAIYRLTAPDHAEVHFARETALLVSGDSWTPFNSQATTWPIELLPLMYLPSTCSFRMTDIWRSFVAQRLMPSFGAQLVITPATVFQERNVHDLMRDFSDEIEGYTGYERFIHCLKSTPIKGERNSVLDDLRRLYEALIGAGFFTEEEMPILDAWICDVSGLSLVD